MPFKRQVISMCVADQSHVVLRSLYAFALPNGDWNNRTSLDVWVPVGAVVNVQELGNIVGNAIVNVFAPFPYTMYKPHIVCG